MAGGIIDYWDAGEQLERQTVVDAALIKLTWVRFELEVGRRPQGTVVSVVGDLDVLTAPQMRDRLVEVIDGGQRDVFVDLTGCVFIDSSGLSALVTALKRIRSVGGDLQLVCPDGNVRRLIEVVALDRVFVLHEHLGHAT
jgi:anti-sigma B factor antagonist